MGSAMEDRAKAAELPEGDVIRILLEQHARIRELFQRTASATGETRQDAFDELRALLAVHETAEQMVLRPASKDAASESVADARNHEEEEATVMLAELEKLDVNSADFDVKLSELKAAVEAHAEAEEHEEFPHVLSSCDEDKRKMLGKRLRQAEAIAPTHPHPSTSGNTKAQYAVGPFASLLDRAKDALKSATD